MNVAHYKRFDWLVIPARDVVVGDLYANGATVTDVVRGPGKAEHWHTKAVKRGQTLICCGEGFATKGRSDRAIIVGRNFTQAAS